MTSNVSILKELQQSLFVVIRNVKLFTLTCLNCCFSCVFRHPKEKDGWPSETLFCFGASVCAVIIALLSTVGYAVFVHMRLLHLENVLRKHQTGLMTVSCIFYLFLKSV